jgi:hypothetical protein
MHVQGGWPKDVDSSDVEHTIRYRKKIEKDEDFARSVKQLGDVGQCSGNARVSWCGDFSAIGGQLPAAPFLGMLGSCSCP